jgi:crotonobetainyl-CoA:carnitine CoA-transferase CaiB-like acyl-CoA transferase
MPSDTKPPLDGIRVLDASRVLAGPFCGQLLGDLGADVIKIERPGSGDDTRSWGPPFAGPLSAYFLSCNRNKRAITLDLAQTEGIKLFHGLVQKSDVLLENFRPASADKLGLGPIKLHTINPRLIICSISGFGRTGSLRELPGYDFAIQALSGLMSITGPVEGPPCKVGVAVTDILTGLYAANAVLACLHARQSSGHGYSIDLALLDCALAAQVNLAQAFLTSGEVPARQGNAHLQIVPYQLFATKDNWIVLAIGNDGQWQRFCVESGNPDLGTDARFATNRLRVQNRDILIPLVEEIMKRRSTAEWQSSLRERDVPHAPVWDYGDVFGQPQIAARDMRVTVHDPEGRPIDLVGSPFHIDGASLPPFTVPSALGADTARVLGELLGISDAELAELHDRGAI